MSTFERMLEVLGAREAGDPTEKLSRTADGEHPALARQLRRLGRGRRVRSRRSQRPSLRSAVSDRKRDAKSTLLSESLERRQLLAITTFAESAVNGGWTTIVAESGDNVFLQEVATSPKSIYVADNSSFKNRTVIGGPVSTGNPMVAAQFHTGNNVSSLDAITITTGSKRRDLSLDAQGYPMVSPGVTRFTLGGDKLTLRISRERYNLSGKFSLVQPNGERTFWTFNNEFQDAPSLTDGIGVNQEVKPGFYYPTAIYAQNVGEDGKKGCIEIRWNVPQLPREAEPLLDAVSWRQFNSALYGSTNGQISEVKIAPSAPQSSFVSLTNATGLGVNPIIGSTFVAELVVDGKRWKVTTGGPSATDNTLYFTGERSGPDENQGVTEAKWGLAKRFPDKNDRSVKGVLETGSAADGFRRGIRLYMSGDYTVEVIEASYCVSTGVGKPVTATMFAGLDITAALDVNLLIPGSKLSIDSPVRVSATRQGGITARASDITFNALATTQNALTVGPALGSDAQALERASAVAEINDKGELTSIRVPNGFGGAGYDPSLPPAVTISAPESVTASARLSFVTNGYVDKITLTAPGSGYKTAPTVTVEQPIGVLRRAVARATLASPLPDGTAGVASVTVDPNQRGAGYTLPPTITFEGGGGSGAEAKATIAGSISQRGIEFTSRGFGYAPNTQIGMNFVSRSDGTGATGYAKTDANGRVSEIVITNEGTGYQPESTEIQFDPPPENTQKKPAVAIAQVDPATRRIVGFEITDKGSGYGKAPLVTVAAPLPVYSASRAVSAIANGAVTGITFESGTGLNTRVNSVDRATGGVTSISVLLNKGGGNYAVGDVLLLSYPAASPGAASDAPGRGVQVRVAEIGANGAATRLEIVSGGAGYQAGSALVHDGGPIKGYGYTAAPNVTLSRPDTPDGVQATATAVLDLDGSIKGFKIDNRGSGYATAPKVWIAEVSPRAQAERVTFNTGVGASVYSLTLADDRNTKDVPRTQLFVSNSGSLAGFFAGNDPSVAPLAGSIVIESHQGDILVAGKIRATEQSYLMQSNTEDAALAPFRLSTDVSGTGIQTGRIMGGTLAVTLANDLDTASIKEDAVAVNEVSLRTAIDSLRIRAARRDGRPVNDPFPYAGSIEELDDITIDAVAASGFPIKLSSLGDMKFTATLETAAGLMINGVKQFTVTGPVSTTKGVISIEAQAITVSNSLRVTDAEEAEQIADIVLTSTNGDIKLDGGSIAARNKVVINQRRRAPKPQYFSNSKPAPILDNKVATLAVEVPQSILSDNVDVSLTITHPSLADLSAKLIAPDRTEIPLFAVKSLTGKNLTGSVFDAEATTTVAAGTAPYTGRFLPANADALRNAYARRPAGTWQIQVSDTVDGNTGTLDAFTLTLNDPEGIPTGRVSGRARIQAATLKIDADGEVGNPTVLPEEDELEDPFFLGADVKNLDALALGSFSLANLGALNVESLRAGGLVSLRASGVDPSIYTADDPKTGKKKGDTKDAALRGTLTDVTQLDVSAPNGSIDLLLNVAGTVTLGNESALAKGESQRAGKFLPMRAAGSVTIQTEKGATGGDFVLYDAPLAGSSARAVRYAVTVDGSKIRYEAGTPSFYASTIRGLTNGALASASPFGSSLTSEELKSLKVGDRILVSNTAAQGLERNGIYSVARLGADPTKDNPGTTWMLIRASDSDTREELPANTMLAVTEGVKRGTFYRVTYPVTAAAGVAKPFGSCDIQLDPVVPRTSIVSKDDGDKVRFVVSTTDGTNASPGSLGKMIRLRQANSPADSPEDSDRNANLSKVSEFFFADRLAKPIQLTQELPKIDTAFTIDGSRRYPDTSITTPIAIEGSRIATTRDGAPVTSKTDVNGLELTWRAGQVTPSPTKAGEGEAVVLRNLVLGGFSQGAAIRVSDFPYATLESLSVGQKQGGVSRLGNKYGVVFNASTEAQDAGVSGGTLSTSEIYNSGTAGVSVQGKASGVTIVGNKIGAAGKDNVVGVEVTSSGIVSIGRADKEFNTILSNGTGVKLAGTGKTTVLKSKIIGNSGDGIEITAGEHTIGFGTKPSLQKSPQKPDPMRDDGNEIATNGRYGIRIDAKTLAAARDLATKQKVFGNYFVVRDAEKDSVAPPPPSKAIFISATDTKDPLSLSTKGELFAYEEDFSKAATYGIDAYENQHLGRGDLAGPKITLNQPEGDGGKLGALLGPGDPVKLTGLDAGAAKAFVLTLEDPASGILEATVLKDAFVLKRGETVLKEGTDYRFVYIKAAGELPRQPLKKPVSIRLETLGGTTYPLGSYRLDVISRSGNPALLTDAVGNLISAGGASYIMELKGATPPQAVTAVAGDGQIALSWSAPSDDGDAEITGYVIQSSVDKGTSWRSISPAAKATDRTVTIPGLTNGQEYTFRVAALTVAGTGQYSAASAPVTPGLAAPAAPKAAASAGSVTLNWSAPVGASGILRYAVQESTDGGKNWKASTFTQPGDLTAANLESTITGLVGGVPYIFRVAAESAVGTGNWSLASSPVLILAAPTGVQATAGDGQNTVTWIAPPIGPPAVIVDYVLQSSLDGGKTWVDVADTVSMAASSTVTATNGLTYVYRVAAKTAAGVGEWSAPSSPVMPLGPASSPLNVLATAFDARASLAWTAPVSNGGAAITDYAIQSSTDGGAKWVTIDDGVKPSPGAEITGLVNGTTYIFRVAAVTVKGTGNWSQASAPVAPRRPASAPLSLVVSGSDARARLTWTVPTSDGGAAITDYAVQRSIDAGRTWVDVVDPVSTATSADVPGLVNGTSYVFRVAAKTAVGLGAWTAASNAVVPARPATAPRAVQVAAGDGSATLTWLAPESFGGGAAMDYIAQRSTDGGQTWITVADGTSTATKMTVAGLVNGSTYVFRVAAVTSAGTGAWSAVTSAVVPRGLATAPQNVRATGADGRVVLTWNAPAALGGSVLRDYVLQSSTNGGASWSNVADGVSTATTATVTGLVNGTAYVYRVAAVTDFATGAFSAATAAVVPLAAPGAISGLVVQPTTSQATLNWQAPVSTGGRPVIDYTIEYQAAGTATWTPWAHAASAATSAVITGLAANTGYLFRVRAVTSFTSGQPVTSTEPVVLLAPPTSLIGRASSGSVALSWLPPRVPATTRIVDYRVQYSVDGVNWITAADGVSAASRTTVRGLTNGTAYLFRVAAVTANGVGSYSATSSWLRPVGPVRRA